MSAKQPFAIMMRQIRDNAVWRVWRRYASAEKRDEEIPKLRARLGNKFEFKAPD